MKTPKKIEVQAKRAFTLIEMIGVLAVIAILAALLIPKIFEAINNARVNNALVSYNTVKTAVMDHYAKYGGIDRTTNGASVAAGSAPGVAATPVPGLGYYDGTLLAEGFLDKPFVTKVGTNSFIHVVASAGVTYDLAAAGGSANDVLGSTYVVEAVIQGLPANDAKDINDRLDSGQPPFTFTLGSDNLTGRVKYSNTATTAWIYITHR
jgi:prepilin-type N-terminal cleavage/methylation domain-containing protein